MIQIDKDDIIKIISVSKNQVTDSFIAAISGHETYEDKEEGLQEHLYECDYLLYEVPMQIQDRGLLIEIFEVLDENEASYFRIINV